MGGRGTAAVRGEFSSQLNSLQKHGYIKGAYQIPMDLSDNADRASHIFGDLPANVKGVTKNININQLKAGQDFIYKEPFQSKTDNTKPITVLYYKGEYIIHDGHHRVLRELWRGNKTIKAKIYKL